MFSKPSLFPKATEPQTPRGGRLVPGGQTPGAASTLNETTPARKEFGMNSTSSPFGTQSAATEQPVSDKNEKDMAVQGGDSSLIVGPNVKLKGAEILDCDILVVEGRVEATMDSRVLRIAEKGAFSGTVGIDVAEIFGQFDGELTARSQLVIHATGRVSGKIRYGKILIEEGGEISGDVKAIDSSAAAKAATGGSGASVSPMKVVESGN